MSLDTVIDDCSGLFIMNKFSLHTMVWVELENKMKTFTFFGLPLALTNYKNRAFVFCILDSSMSVSISDLKRKHTRKLESGRESYIFETEPKGDFLFLDLTINS